MPELTENIKEREFITALGERVFKGLLSEFEEFSGLSLNSLQQNRIETELSFLEAEFFGGLDKSYTLAKKTSAGEFHNKARVRYYNNEMDEKLKLLSEKWPRSANVFVIGGLLFKNHVAGIKNLYGFDDDGGAVIDVLGSATSIALGAHNPYVSIFDRVEDMLQIRDNICTPYHPGIRQAFFLEKISKLYPGDSSQVVIHSESSGAVVDSIAIESALAFIEKRTHSTEGRILAVDGTWAGGYGAAREATGFGVDSFTMKRLKKNLHIDRCLPSPTKENAKEFLSILKNKTDEGAAAGLYLEADIVGDSGIELVERELLCETLSILGRHKLPVIADCVQQLGRTGGYWGENVESLLKNYPWLILTTAKSASNGLPFAYTIMPKEIAEAVNPLTHISTNQFNGPLLRAIAVSEIMLDEAFQNFINAKGKIIEESAEKYGIPLGVKGLRGKFMNRAVYVGSNDNVKLMQIALLVEDGILIGALPKSLRYQPMLLEYSKTNELVADVIFRRVNQVMKGNITKTVEEVFNTMKGVDSGLAR